MCLESGSVMPPALFFLASIDLAIEVFCGSVQTLGWFFYFCDKRDWHFDRDWTG